MKPDDSEMRTDEILPALMGVSASKKLRSEVRSRERGAEAQLLSVAYR